MTEFTVEVRRTVEGAIDVEADDAEAAIEKVESMSDSQFDGLIDASHDEIEVLEVSGGADAEDE